MSFRGPDVKGLLGQIPGVGFRAGEAHRKSVARLVEFVHHRLKLVGRVHDLIGSVGFKISRGHSFHWQRDGTMGLRNRSGRNGWAERAIASARSFRQAEGMSASLNPLSEIYNYR